MNNKLQTGIKAVYAGFMIGLGGIVYLSVENKIAGSLNHRRAGFFSVHGKDWIYKKGQRTFRYGRDCSGQLSGNSDCCMDG